MPTRNHSRSLLHRVFPFIEWLKGYGTATFRSDAVAGITVAVVLVPQAMAYAMLAGLPPVYGLYAASVAPWVGALWGSLRQLGTGPIAIMSLLVLTTLTPMAEPGSARFVEMAILLAHLVGIIYLLVGVFGMGQIMSFISHSAVKGFTAAASLIITATQLPHLLGLEVGRHEYIFPMLLEILRGLSSIHFTTAAIGVFSFGVIYGLKRWKPQAPAGLIALGVTAAAVYLFHLHESGVVVVGDVPSGLPMPQLPLFDPAIGFSLLGPAMVIALVSFAETYSVGKAISLETKQKVDVDQEFIGQGMANLAGSFLQCYPVAGSFSRTAINYSAGAKTGISSVVSSVIVVVALLFLTPLLTYIPRAALAALVISAVLLLFHPKEVLSLWKQNRHDGIVAVTVFVLALVSKPDYALLLGVMMSLIFFLWKTMHPRIVRITKDPEFNMFVNAELADKPSCPQILHLRSDNTMYFANAEYTVEHILERVDQVETPLKFLLLDFQAVGFIDLTGIDELRSLDEELKERGIRLAMMAVHRPVMEAFERSGFTGEIDSECLIDSSCLMENKGEAITRLFEGLDHDYCRSTCPHALFNECSTVKDKGEPA